MSSRRHDNVKRPDHYRCLKCKFRFNDAVFEKEYMEQGVGVIAKCPSCKSSKIIISWWKKQ